MLLKEEIEKKWAKVLDHPDLPKISDPWKRAQTGLMLENNVKAIQEEAQLLNETLPVNYAGTGGYSTGAAAGGPVAGYDPILISLVRRAAPKFMAYDVAGVQAMSGPTGLIFAMRSMYANVGGSITVGGTGVEEAFYNEANTAFSGNGTHTPFDTANVNPATGNTSYFNLGANTGYGYPNLVGEDLGGATAFKKMGFSIEKVTVTANTRGLDAGYTLELAQDLKAVHGLDAETELSNILSTEILAEINREVIRTIYITAKVGAQLANSAGVFNLTDTADTDGRWAVEKYKSLIFLIERECNKIMKDTRRGKGNILIVSSDVASALVISGLLDYDSGLKAGVDGLQNDGESTFVGVLAGRIKVYVDPYSVSGADYVVAGYRGTSVYDAGLFYCPYVPLQMVRAIDPSTYQPKIGFKTRYGLVANPFAEGTSAGLGRLVANTNQWYRKFIVRNLK